MQFEENYDRRVRPLPDQDQRLRRDEVTDRPSRRARPAILVAIAVALVGIFVVLLIAGPDDEPQGPIGAPASSAVV